MKSFACLAAMGAIIVLWSVASGAAELKKKRTTTRVARPMAPALSQTKLFALRKALIDRMKGSREKLKDAVPLYEEKLAQQSADFEASERLYDEDLISRAELENREQAMTNTRQELQRVREWIAEDDVSLPLAENAAREKLEQLAELNGGEFDESEILIRYDGQSSWSFAEIEKIAGFYYSRFGRPMPISAMGQSSTHDRMGLDHREALDIALLPDSEEGRALIGYLRNNGIPFIAFRRRARGMSTGAHIYYRATIPAPPGNQTKICDNRGARQKRLPQLM